MRGEVPLAKPEVCQPAERTTLAPGVLSLHRSGMKRPPLPSIPAFIASLAVAALLTWLLAWHPFAAVQVEDPAFLRLVCASPTEGKINISLDEGHGYFVDRSPEFSGPLAAANGWRTLEAPLPPGRVRALRVEVEGTPEFRVQSATLHLTTGRVLAELKLSDLLAVSGTKLELRSDFIRVVPSKAGVAAGFTVRFVPPLLLPTGDEPWAWEVLALFAGVFAVVLGLQWRLIDWSCPPRATELVANISRATQAQPKLTIAAVAVMSLVANTYPTLFFGKSLVSPNTLAYLLYVGEPTIANAPVEPTEHGAGSDLGATMWQSLPYSVVESQALWRDHELPLWNRYNSGGVSLLGQGLSMLGDPLHCIPLLAGGAWWAWDVKFLLAKALFAIGIGLCAWSYSRLLAPSALVAASVVWIGFFVQRYNHPAYFGLCYAPWILLAWLGASTGRQNAWPWAAALLLADWMELTSGTAKEASILLLSLNVAGLLVLVLSASTWRERWRKVGPMLWASGLFLLLSAPAWLLFLDALRHAVTVYDLPKAYQLQPGMLIAFFDAVFAQDFTRHERVTQPSLNFLILVGLLWAHWGRRGAPFPVRKGLAWAAAGAAAFTFGIVPPTWIVQVPFLGKIEHIYNGFGCVLLVLLPILATPGIGMCLSLRHERLWRATWTKVLLSLLVLLALYLGLRQARPLSPYASYRLEPFLQSRFYLSYVPSLVLAALAVPWSLRWLREARTRGAGLLLGAVCLVVLHFRSGMYGETKFDSQVMNPRTGVELAAASPAIAYVKKSLDEPGRVYGFSATLTPGYNALLGLEGICGPDALHNPYYQELCTAAGLRLVWGWRWVMDPASLAQLHPLYDLLNLRFYLRELDGPSPQLPGLKLAGKADLEVYESKTVWPRAFFTDSWTSYQTAGDFAEMLKKGDGRPFAALQGTTPDSKVGYLERIVVPAESYRLTNNTTAFTVHAPSAGLVALTEAYEERNFEVLVNGAKGQTVRVNHAFKGVFLPAAGEYRITFSYLPKMLAPALWLAGIGLLLSAGTVLFALLRSGWWKARQALVPVPLTGKPLPLLT